MQRGQANVDDFIRKGDVPEDEEKETQDIHWVTEENWPKVNIFDLNSISILGPFITLL